MRLLLPCPYRFGPLLAAAALIGACQAQPAGERPIVAVSIAPQAWFVKQLAGDRVDVRVLLPPGASPAQYEPEATTLRTLGKASLYVRVAHPHFPFEAAWIDPLLSVQRELTVIAPWSNRSEADHDPHVWLDPERARTASSALAAALSELLPAAREAIETNRRALDAQIAELQAQVRTQLKPCAGHRFFAQHAAWQRLVDGHGLRQIAVEQGHREPDARELATIIREARDAGVRTLFVQPQFSARAARLVAEEIGAEVEALDPLAYEWSDNLLHAASRIAAASVP